MHSPRQVQEQSLTELDHLRAEVAILQHERSERLRLEALLRRIEHRCYGGLLDKMPILLHSTDRLGRLVSVSDEWLTMLGYSRDEVIGRPVGDFMSNASRRQAEVVPITDDLENASYRSMSRQFVKKNGEVMDVLTSSVALLDDAGSFGQRLTVLIDVGERHHTEEALRIIAEGVSSATGEVFFSQLVEHLAATLGSSVVFVGELKEGKTETVATIAASLDGGIVENFEYDLLDTPCETVFQKKKFCIYADGVQQQFPRDRWLQENRVLSYVGTPLLDSRGNVIGLLAVADRKPLQNPRFSESLLRIFAVRASAELERIRVEQAVQQARDQLEMRVRERTAELTEANQKLVREINERQRTEEHLRETTIALENAGEGIALLNTEGRYISVNRAFAGMLGYETDEMLEMHWQPTVHPEDVAKSQSAYEHMMTHGKVETEVRGLRKDGTVFDKQVSMIKAFDGEKRFHGHYCFVKDITERKQATEKMRRHQADMAHVARLSTVGEMASGLAHELNQPLCSISTYAQACLRMTQSGNIDYDELRMALEDVAQQSIRAGQIIHRLRHFVSKQEPRTSAVSINDLVREVADFMDAEARAHGIAVRLRLSDQSPLVSVDAIQIEQVILNLIRNSLEAMQDSDAAKREVIVESMSSGRDKVEISVHDTGHCVPGDILRQVFDPFFTTKSQGMGLGLSISRSIIEAHGGRLWATSDSEGTTFHFTLPANSENLLVQKSS